MAYAERSRPTMCQWTRRVNLELVAAVVSPLKCVTYSDTVAYSDCRGWSTAVLLVGEPGFIRIKGTNLSCVGFASEKRNTISVNRQQATRWQATRWQATRWQAACWQTRLAIVSLVRADCGYFCLRFSLPTVSGLSFRYLVFIEAF